MNRCRINVQELLDKEYRADYLMDFGADLDKPIAMLYQSGYITIKEYYLKENRYRLDFPNDEVRNGFLLLMANNYFMKSEPEVENTIINIERMLRRVDLDGMRDAFTAFLSSILYDANKDERTKSFETHFSYTFYIINRLL